MKAVLVVALFFFAASQVNAGCDIDGVKNDVEAFVDDSISLKDEVIEEVTSFKLKVTKCVSTLSSKTPECVIDAATKLENKLKTQLEDYEETAEALVSDVKSKVLACI